MGSTKLDRKVVKVKMTGILDEGTNDERRNYNLFDRNDKEIDFVCHFLPPIPKDMPAKTLSIPDGFEIVGMASQNNQNGSIGALAFVIWKRPA